jgi:hypothetical protein
MESEIHYRVHRNTRTYHILSHLNPVHTHTISLRPSLTFSFHLRLSVPSGFSLQVSDRNCDLIHFSPPPVVLYDLFISPVRASGKFYSFSYHKNCLHSVQNKSLILRADGNAGCRNHYRRHSSTDQQLLPESKPRCFVFINTLHNYSSGQYFLNWCFTAQACQFASLPLLTVPSYHIPLPHPASVKIILFASRYF